MSTTMYDRENASQTRRASPYVVLFNIIHLMTVSNFKSPGLLDDERMEHELEAGRQLLRSTRNQPDARYAISHMNYLRDIVRAF